MLGFLEIFPQQSNKNGCFMKISAELVEYALTTPYNRPPNLELYAISKKNRVDSVD
jgi:hypothetical protein